MLSLQAQNPRSRIEIAAEGDAAVEHFHVQGVQPQEEQLLSMYTQL